MSIEEKFNTRNAELQHRVISEMEKVKEGQSEKSIIQLQTILEELQKSSDEKNVTLCYPWFIVDSWECTDPLGIDLINLAELYKKIQRGHR